MVARLIARLQPAVSTVRLERYRSEDGSELGMLVNYLWNVALGESPHFCLQAVEVTLRNSLHQALARRFGTPTWYDLHGLLDEEQRKQVDKTKRTITQYGHDVTPGRVVSELTFGFWVTLLSRPYDARLWRGSNAASLKTAFPRVPRPLRQRATIHQRYNEIRLLRNRVFHFEPLFDDPQLLVAYRHVHQGIRWINPTMAATIELLDRFQQTYESGRGEIEGRLMRLEATG